MIDQTTPRFKAAIAEALEPFGVHQALPIKNFKAAPVRILDVLKQVGHGEDVWVLGDHVEFDATRKLITTKDQPIDLTEKEALLLKTLLEADGEVTRESLLKTVWGYAEDVDTHTLETHIHRLRTKLKALLDLGDVITTTAGGYGIYPSQLKN